MYGVFFRYMFPGKSFNIWMGGHHFENFELNLITQYSVMSAFAHYGTEYNATLWIFPNPIEVWLTDSPLYFWYWS